MKVIFFDRDGTIVEDYEDLEWKSIDVLSVIPNAINAMRHVISLGYKIIIVTNQYLIGEKIITEEKYNKLTHYFLNDLNALGVEILDIFYCPHSRNDHCSCMKPKTGLIQNALKCYPDIEIENSYIVGDSWCDMQLAENMNMNSFSVRKGNMTDRNIVIDDIIQLIDFIK